MNVRPDRPSRRPILAGTVVSGRADSSARTSAWLRVRWANFALTRLRPSSIRADGCPKPQRAARRRRLRIKSWIRSKLFDTVEAAVADCTLLFATTPRQRPGQAVIGPQAGRGETCAKIASRRKGRAAVRAGKRAGLAQRRGGSLSDRHHQHFRSIPRRLAQSRAGVLLLGYEWFKLATLEHCRSR